MPLRTQTLVALCRLCREPAPVHCLRCGTPLCDEHAPSTEDLRCDRCESGYEKKTTWLQGAANGRIDANLGRTTVALLSVLLAPWVVAIFVGLAFAIAQSASAAAVLIGLLSGSIFSGWLFSRWYKRTPPRSLAAKAKLRKMRKKFLAKRAKPILELPPGPTD